MENYVITISRRFGSNGHAVAGEVSRMLGIPVYDRSAVEAMAHLGGESADEEPARGRESEAAESDRQEAGVGLLKGLFRREPKDDMPDEAQIEFEKQSEVIRLLAQEGPCIIIGRCGDYVLSGRENLIRVFIYADPDYCLEQAKKRGAFGGKTTMKYIEETNKYRADYYKYYTGHDWNDCRFYDLCLNSAAIGFEGCVKAIKEYIKIRFPEYKNDAL